MCEGVGLCFIELCHLCNERYPSFHIMACFQIKVYKVSCVTNLYKMTQGISSRTDRRHTQQDSWSVWDFIKYLLHTCTWVFQTVVGAE